MPTIKDVAKAAGVSTATVSAVVNDSAYVSPPLRARVLEAVRELGYAPSQIARNLRRGRSELIAIVVADLANPFYARVVCAAEAAVAGWGYSLVVCNSDENPDAEKRILARIRMLHCEGLILVPVSNTLPVAARDTEGRRMPTVLFGRSFDDNRLDAVTIDNFAAALSGDQLSDRPRSQPHRRDRQGRSMSAPARAAWRACSAALAAKGLAARQPVRASGRVSRGRRLFRRAQSAEHNPTGRPRSMSPTALMALGVMRAISDLGLRCPEDVSVASTDNIPGVRGLRPVLTRTEHPIVDMVNEAVRLLVDRDQARARWRRPHGGVCLFAGGRRQLRAGEGGVRNCK